MNYMLDKLNKLEKKDVILGAGDKIVEELINNKDLDDSERLMAIEYAVAKLNNILYNISGDEKEQIISIFFVIILVVIDNDIFRLQCYYSSK